MSATKKRSEQHIIDQAGERLLRSKLPEHWLLREYRPDYGLDFTIETFKSGKKQGDKAATCETLGEHIFVQLKSASDPEIKQLAIYGRGNVEKAQEVLNHEDKVADLYTYRFQLEVSELATVERMGVGVPVLLVIAGLAAQRCPFVCLNDYIDKILVPRHVDYKIKDSRAIHVSVSNEIGTDRGFVALRWYPKRPKLFAAFQRFTYQYQELQWAEHSNWRELVELFAQRIVTYDFWDDTEMCTPIGYDGAGLRRFIATGQPGFMKVSPNLPSGFDPEELTKHFSQMDVFELWRLLALLPKTYEDVWREWFLPTAVGVSSSQKMRMETA